MKRDSLRPVVLYIRVRVTIIGGDEMTVRAYILITTKPGASESVVRSLKETKGVVQAESVYGRFDVIALVEAPDLKTLSEVVYKAVGKHPDVVHTETSIALFER